MLRPASGTINVDGTDLATAPPTIIAAVAATHFGFVLPSHPPEIGRLLRELATNDGRSPACGMAVTTGDSLTLERDGHTWWFRSGHCRDEFTAEPDRFVERMAT